MPTTRSQLYAAAISRAMACTAPSNWAQLISRTIVRGRLRSCPSRPRGSSLCGERVCSGDSGRRRVDRGGMDGRSLARRRGGDQRPQLLARDHIAGRAELTGGFCLTVDSEEVLELGPSEGEERPVDSLAGAATAELERALGKDVHLGFREEGPEEGWAGAVRL